MDRKRIDMTFPVIDTGQFGNFQYGTVNNKGLIKVILNPPFLRHLLSW